MQLDPQTLSAIDAIRGRGYAVSLSYDKTTWVATARDAGGETWTVRAGDAHAAVVEIAVQLGVDLEDPQ